MDVSLWLLLAGLAWNSAAGCEEGGAPPPCPASCRCAEEPVVCIGDEDETKLNLCNMNLSRVPRFTGVYNSLTILDLSGNFIISLRSEDFTSSTFPSLATLYLNSNRITDVSNTAIQLPTLYELNLANNELILLDFLTTEESFSAILRIYVNENPLRCEELDTVLAFMYERGAQLEWSIMGAACTFKDGEESSLEGLQSEYYGEFVDVDATPRGGEGPNVAVIAGATAGGVVVVVAVIVLVIVVIIVLLCWKGSRAWKKKLSEMEQEAIPPKCLCSGRQPEVQSVHYVRAHHFAPPSLPPLPPPLDIPSSDEIYAEIGESPATASTIVSTSSPDYEDGYILNVESVPRKPSRSFAGIRPPGDYNMAAPNIGGRKKLPPLSPEPSGPSPYRSISIPKATARRSRAETAPGGSGLHKKKPPIMPRKKSLKSQEESEENRDLSVAAGRSIRELESGTTLEVGGAGKEADYMEIIL